MARIRTIKPEFWTSAQVMECSPNARLLFIGLWNFCDDAGRHPLSARRIKAEIMPGDDISSENVRRMVDELASVGLLDIYTVEGKEFLQVTGWHHQKIDKPQKPRYPGKDEADCPNDSPNVRRMVADGREGKGEDRKGKKEAAAAVEGISARGAAMPQVTDTPNSAQQQFARIEKACHDALPAEAMWRVRQDFDLQPILAAMQDGADLDLDVVPTIRTAAQRVFASGKSVGKWSYFCDAIRDSAKTRKAVNGHAQEIEKDKQAGWEWAAERFVKGDTIPMAFTPQPGLGGCKWPQEILDKYGIDRATGKVAQRGQP